MELAINNVTYNLTNLPAEEVARLRHMKVHEEHRGHETMHLEMFLIAVFSSFAAQFALMAWKKYHYKTYHRATLLGMWVFPLIYSIYMVYVRFVIVWSLFSLMTGVMVYLSSRPRISTSTPRRVYWWFLLLHKIFYTLSVGGYVVILLAIFLPDLIPPEVAFVHGGFAMLYGIYFGLIARDFAEVCTDKMAAHIGYYNADGMPTRRIDPGVCALCTNILQNDDIEKKYRLNCSHVFHEFCLRGWCIVGKKDICPYCKEKVSLSKMIKNPWEKPHILFGNFLDVVRYLIAWQPLILFTVHAVIYLLGLK
ncbi:unnamed protein product [Dibothriocephalus latus]|uniref:RING-type domain-containing protein n=1 Tax=Dibothriocephalus latus TaxID=60516 RepID=A0A3P6UUZ2_DIBLA|nr:unnamed protein product [Dibothriocephalus latus]